MAMSNETWRANLKDGTFVEGVKHSGEHVHYDPRNGSDVLVSIKNEKTGESVNIRNIPISQWVGKE